MKKGNLRLGIGLPGLSLAAIVAAMKKRPKSQTLVRRGGELLARLMVRSVERL
ncbi:hypothetical protein QPK87_04830 [Kamptonema cortianum]|nr:hypothetical protein [Geitlerinema splendidum]MDK3155901.1 hypothetical protein [Kamptonema cortianum]